MENIWLTIKYFDMFDYALKRDEIWQWLFNQQITRSARKRLSGQVNQKNKYIREEFNDRLDELVKQHKIEEKSGYYFLRNRHNLIDIRKERQKFSLKKIHKARRIARLLGLLPGLKMIAICSNLGYLNAEEEADIDLFIVAEKGRIWSVRFWCVVLMKLLGQRPAKDKQKNKICLSYFVTEESLDLEQTKVDETDVHLIYLVAQYLPIYDEHNVWQRYIEENSWIKKYLPNFEYSQAVKKFLIKPQLVWLKKLINQTALGFEERLYKRIQLKLMAPELKKMMNRGDKKVIINNKMLKLHTNDKRREYNKKIFNF